LRVSPDGRRLQHADGTPFFWLRDTAWKIVRLDPGEVRQYLADRQRKRFNVIQFNASCWPEEKTPNHAGEYPFLGAGPPWSQVRFNERFWCHVDFIVDEAQARGLYLALVTMWGKNAGRPGFALFTNAPEHNYRYGRALGEHYGDRPHIIWVPSGEYHSIDDDARSTRESVLTPSELGRVRRIAEGIRDGLQGGSGGRRMTFHPWSGKSSSEDWHQDPLVDFHMIQTHSFHQEIGRLVYGDWTRVSPKPTLNAEGGYEGEDDTMYRGHGSLYDSGWGQRFQAYWSAFAGGIGYTYGHKNFWRMEDNDGAPGLHEPALDAPGALSMQHLRALMESNLDVSWVPDTSLISSGRGTADELDLILAIRATEGQMILAYTTQGHAFMVDTSKLRGDAIWVQWFDPRTGEYQRMGALEAGGERTFCPPGDPGRGNDWVLVLDTTLPEGKMRGRE
jgi:hypothetical protein